MRIPYYQMIVLALFLCSGCGDEAAQPPATESTVAIDEAEQTSSAEVTQPSTEATSVDSEEPDNSPGLAIGEMAPGFELRDQNGEMQSLAGLLETGNVALVFYRSADW